jgi:SNF2 family DNA or RNA helicase
MKSLYLKSQNIDVSKVDFSFMKIEPYKYQKQAAVFFDACNGRALLGDQPGVGKEAPLDTLISTPKGWVKMGNIKVGDKIHNRFGGVSNVIGVYPQGKKDSYKIHFNDGTFTKCGLEHLWNVRDANRRQRNNGWTVKSLKELIDSKLEYKVSPSRKNRKPILKWEIPITKPVYYNKKKYLIDPYIMGIILGDGNLCSGSISISVPDFQFDIVENILKKLPKEYVLSENRSATCPRYSIVKSESNESLNNLFIQEIKKLNINVRSENKFIPNIYKFGSKKQRQELLRGLMDSDGSCFNNRINFHSSSKRLSEDVVELVQSLGGIAKLKSYNRTNENKGIEYRVNIKVPFCPFNLESKKKEWNPVKTNYISKYISKIEFFKKEEQQCIAVDSEDNTYLTDSFIVTHNTASAMTYACWKKRKTIIICPANLRLNWRKEILNFTNEKAFVYKWKPTKKSKKTNYSKEESLFHIVGYDSLKSYIEIETSHTCKNVFCGWKEKNSKRRYKDKICPKCNSRASVKSRATKNLTFVPDKDNIYINPNDYELIIMDEAHYIKNNSADRTKMVKKVFKEIPEKLLLTGTAIKSRPYEFFSLLNFLYPEEFSNAHYFGVKYCAGEKNNFGWNYDGASNLDELFEKISPFFLRRLKKDVLKFLPPKTYSYIPVELTTTEQREYNKIHKGIIEEGKEDDDKLNHLTRIQYLKHFTSMIKLKKSFEFIQDIIDGGEKVVVFSQYKDVSYELGNKFGDKCVVYNGDKSANQKEEAVELFMNDDNVQVFAGDRKSVV